ncbi:hypothetical protein DFH29DRAFT_999145 [Suillus ampliporus]|nr:hypothetical protein DFH29DRAFT_999145 [Suillus ampliporus]
MGRTKGIGTPLVKPQVDSPSGPGVPSVPMLERQDALASDDSLLYLMESRRTSWCHLQQKENLQEGSKSMVQTPDQSDGAGSTPTLHIAENSERFGFQKNPVPLGYIGLQPLGSEEHPVCLKSHIQQDRPCSHTHTEVATRPTVEPPVMHAPAVHGMQSTIPRPKPSNLPVRKKSSGAENEETKHHSDKNMTDVYDELNMVNDNKFPPSNDEMCTSPPIKFSLDRHRSAALGMHLERTMGRTGMKILVIRANHKLVTCMVLANKLAPMQSQKCVGCRTKAAKSIQDSAVVAKWKTLGFFPDLWVKLLNYTKACFRLHLAITDPFPTHEEALSDTGICLELITESIVTWEAQNRHLEAGFYPQYEYDMATVIYNDSINFCSRIKQITINIVPVEYKLSSSESEIKQKVRNVIHVYWMYGHVNMKQTALGDSEKVYWKLTNMLKQVTNDKYHSKKLDDKL